MFDSGLPSLAQWLVKTPCVHGTDDENNHDDEPEWYGGTWDDALGWCRSGWPEGSSVIQNAPLFKGKRQQARKRSRYVDSVSGGLPIVPAAIMGLPVAYRRPIQAERPTPITIAVNVSAGCRITSAQKIAWGACVARWILDQQVQGVRIRLYVYASADNHFGRFITATVKLKDFGQALSLHTLAMGIVQPAFQRRLVFGIRRRDATCNWLLSGYGVSNYDPDSVRHLFPPKTLIVCPDYDRNPVEVLRDATTI